MNETVIRYVIRSKGYGYYNGKNTYNSPIFILDEFSKAKVFKNIAGAKVACLKLWEHGIKELEIVEIETKQTDNVIKYEGYYVGSKR